jgi:trimethylamine-N-oxide reductase cytochrome c-type subunit TorC
LNQGVLGTIILLHVLTAENVLQTAHKELCDSAFENIGKEMGEKAMSQSSMDGSKKKKKSPKRKLLILAILLLIILIGGAFAVDYTSKPSFCNTCHVMNGFTDSWEESSHKDVACIDCHSEPGIAGMLAAKMNGASQVWVNLTNKPDPAEIKAKEEDINCINCHQDRPRMNEISAAAAKDPHTNKHTGDKNCTTVGCHDGLTHDAGKNKDRPTRSSCFTCHLNDMDL